MAHVRLLQGKKFEKTERNKENGAVSVEIFVRDVFILLSKNRQDLPYPALHKLCHLAELTPK